jgi:hypothetical protein
MVRRRSSWDLNALAEKLARMAVVPAKVTVAINEFLAADRVPPHHPFCTTAGSLVAGTAFSNLSLQGRSDRAYRDVFTACLKRLYPVANGLRTPIPDKRPTFA